MMSPAECAKRVECAVFRRSPSVANRAKKQRRNTAHSTRFARFVYPWSFFVTLYVAACFATKASAQPFERENGGIVRGPKTAKAIALVFTGHEFAEGGETILAELARHGAKASFFLTGDFLTN